MMGFGAIEIEEATYCLGMSGHIVMRVNKTGIRYQINHSMDDGFQVSENRDGTWSKPQRMNIEEFVELLPAHKGWDANSFIAAWAAFSSGYEKGEKHGEALHR